MEERRNHLDSLFGVALVLLGILSAAELQYFLTVEEALHFYALRVFTMPFLVLIVFWLVKEIFSDVVTLSIRMLFTEFCWDFWSFTLFYYLLAMLGSFLIGIICSFVLSVLMVSAITWAYSRTSPVTSGNRSMYNYYKHPLWMAFRSLIFVGAYILLMLIITP